MTLEQSLLNLFAIMATISPWLLGASVLVPAVGILAARIGRGGRTDKDGRVLANSFIFLGMFVFVCGLILASTWVVVLGRSLLQLHIGLMLAPPLWLGLTVVGMHRVFPLAELRAGQLLRDAGLLLMVVCALLWFFSQFRGWGIVFFGGISQLVVVLVAMAWLVRRLLRRITGKL